MATPQEKVQQQGVVQKGCAQAAGRVESGGGCVCVCVWRGGGARSEQRVCKGSEQEGEGGREGRAKGAREESASE